MAQQDQGRKVPVLRSEQSFVIEQEFDSIREKFEQEMRRMEEEMSRFRSQVIASERSRVVSSSATQQLQQTSSSSRTVSQKSGGPKVGGLQPPKRQASGWIGELDSPLIREEGDGAKVLRLRFDVTSYEPEQIVVKTLDNRLIIHAHREEKGANSSSYREYNREFLLPEGADPELIRSSLSADGVLTVEAPLVSALE